MTEASPFRSQQYDLNDSIALDMLKPIDAEMLASAFAEIDPWRRLQFSAVRLQAFFSETASESARYAITQDGETAGFVCVEPAWLCGPYLHFLGVLPQFQGHGIGAAVMTWFIGQARAASQRNAWICVSAFNADARRFYERYGFAEAVKLDDLVRTGEAEILLRKQLFT